MNISSIGMFSRGTYSINFFALMNCTFAAVIGSNHGFITAQHAENMNGLSTRESE